jgi:hypothetical protein
MSENDDQQTNLIEEILKHSPVKRDDYTPILDLDMPPVGFNVLDGDPSTSKRPG